jgi:trans-2,3-dihydro-3-hydroxyanthranilate isomerase
VETKGTRTLRFLTADVFTSAVFSGNQLAIVFGAEGLGTDVLQNIAKEFNYSETVFVFDADDASHTRRVRIFTPGAELPFAGHPTIGTAHALVATGMVPASGNEVIVTLGEGVGPVPVRVTLVNGVPTNARLTTAKLPEERSEGVPTIEQLAEVLSLQPDDFVGGNHSPAGVSVGIPFLMVPVQSVDAVKRARVKMDAFDRYLRGQWASEMMVFAMGRESDESTLAEHVRGCDVRARVFVPGLAVPEDPATGSACGCLAGYLAKRTPRDGALRWDVAQGVEMGRPSRITIEVEKRNGEVAAVHVGGSTVLVSEGTMRIPA